MAEDKNQSPIRNQQLKVIGMFKDASPSGINPPDSMFKSNPQYAFDIKNMRFSPLDGPFLFDIVNEKGNTKLNIKNITTNLYEDQNIPDTDNLEIKGTPIGINVFNDATNMFSIVAIEESVACLIDINVLKNLALKNSLLTMKLIEYASSTFKDSILNFISLAHKQVNGRVADLIIYLSEKVYKEKDFAMTLTRKELAEFAGCSQENIIHTLRRFHKEGVINTDGKRIKILDSKRLLEISKLG